MNTEPETKILFRLFMYNSLALVLIFSILIGAIAVQQEYFRFLEHVAKIGILSTIFLNILGITYIILKFNDWIENK